MIGDNEDKNKRLDDYKRHEIMLFYLNGFNCSINWEQNLGLLGKDIVTFNIALDKCELYTPVDVVEFMITTSYAGYNTILNIKEITITNTAFTDSVIITGIIDKNKYIELESILYKNKIDPQALQKTGESIKEIKLMNEQ
jgi:hypothetical protein